MPLEIVINDPTSLCATYENVYIDMWWDGATAQILAQMREHRLAFMKRTQGPLYTCGVIYATKLRGFPKDVRNELEGVLQDGKGRFVGDALAVLQAGPILMGALRMLMSGVRLVTRSDHAMEFFSSIPDAVEWIAPLAKVDNKGLLLAIHEAAAAHQI
jgi:hypothetical protein